MATCLSHGDGLNSNVFLASLLLDAHVHILFQSPWCSLDLASASSMVSLRVVKVVVQLGTIVFEMTRYALRPS